MRTGTCDRCGEPFEDTSPAQKRRFCSDNCRKRHCDDTTGRGVCIDCGGPTGSRSRAKGYQRCRECHHSFDRARLHERALQVEAWWAEGLTLRQIADRLGWSMNAFKKEFDRVRQAGYELPYRRSEQAVRNIRAANCRFQDGRQAA